MASFDTATRASHEQLGYHLQASRTRQACIIGLFISWVVGLASFAFGLYSYFTFGNVTGQNITDGYGFSKYSFTLNDVALEVVALAINAMITLVNESMGYTHSTTLRWSLQQEGRLEFNSNLRLFSRSKKSKPNSWYSNSTFLICIILSYASASSFIWYTGIEIIRSFPMVIFGASVVIQAGITTWALVTTRIPTWSSSPLDTTFACLEGSAMDPLIRSRKRCMKSVHDKVTPCNPCIPKERQGSLLAVRPDMKWILGVVWAIIPLGSIWFGIIIAPYKYLEYCNWNPLTAVNTNGSACATWIKWTATDNSGTAINFATILVIAALQSPLTIGLHCTELLCNLSRDERAFRLAISPQGINPRQNSIWAAVTSWETISLFILKSILHWMFSMGLNTQYLNLMMFPPQILYCTICILLLALFATYISRRRPSGPLPATYGHLQTLADLVDEWQGDSPMFWGHKVDASNGKPNFAGIGSEPMKEIKMDELYG